MVITPAQGAVNACVRSVALATRPASSCLSASPLGTSAPQMAAGGALEHRSQRKALTIVQTVAIIGCVSEGANPIQSPAVHLKQPTGRKLYARWFVLLVVRALKPPAPARFAVL